MEKTQELKVKTAVRALWSQEKLHVAFECLEDRPREMKFQPREKNDTEICLDSSVEIFLNPSGDRGTYFQILVNPAGSSVNNAVTTLEGKKAFDTSWVSGADVAVKINPDSWVVEMSIPFKSMNFAGKENASIVANFCRSRHLKADETAAQLQTWSPLLVRGFHDPDKFGTITLAGKSDGVLYGSFEGPRDTPSFSSLGSISLACSTDKASEGTTSLRLEFPKGKNHDCVGVKFGHFPVAGDDWPAFSAIKADLYLEGTEPQKLGVRLDANTKTGFAWGAAQLQPGWNKDVALVDLSAIDWSKAGQTTPPSRVESLLLYTYTDAVAGSGVVFLDNLRFIRRQE
jgi:hypothetical protein